MTYQRRGTPDRRHGGSRPPDQHLDPGYLGGGYFDQKENLRPEVVTDSARRVAKLLARENMSNSQLRRFFGYVQGIRRRLYSGQEFSAVQADIGSLSPKVDYAVAKSRRDRENPVPRVFKDFIDINLKCAIAGKKQFMAFQRHFEAVVGYHRYFKPN